MDFHKPGWTPANEVCVKHRRVRRHRTGNRSRRRPKRGYVLTEVILDHLTDFIWLTPREITAIVELVHEDIEEHRVLGTLWHLVRMGEVERRTDPGEGRLNAVQFKKRT
jgi:hypothetical protein